MKSSEKKAGDGRGEAKSLNADVSSEEKSLRGVENERKSRRKNRDAKSCSDVANHTAEIENELAQMRQHVSALTSQVDETNALLGEVLQASSDLEAALKEMKTRRAESEAREAALERALELAERNSQAGKQQIGDLQAVLSRERQQAAEMCDTIAALQNRLVIEREHISALTVGAAAADASSTRSRLQVESLNAVLAATESNLAEALMRAAHTDSELRVVHRRGEGLKRDLEGLEAALVEERLRSASLAQDLETARQAVMDKQLILERRDHEIDALSKSTSWRLGAPLKAFKRQLSRLRRLMRGKKAIPLFDRRWYLQQYPDVKEGEIDPYDHYLRHGAIEGRDPSPYFDTDWYLQCNSDVNEIGQNPLIHFYLHGAVEGRDPHPLYSNKWFIDRYPTLQFKRAIGITAFLKINKNEAGRRTKPKV